MYIDYIMPSKICNTRAG